MHLHNDDDIQILITGCQRSGTRFWAKYLAEAFGIPYVDEDDYGVDDFDKLLECLRGGIEGRRAPRWCVHGPALKPDTRLLIREYPNVKIIWMSRDPAETVTSMQRLKWEKSSIVELRRMLELTIRFGLPQYLWLRLYTLVVRLSQFYGIILQERGNVTVVRMEDLSHAEGFVNGTREAENAVKRE